MNSVLRTGRSASGIAAAGVCLIVVIVGLVVWYLLSRWSPPVNVPVPAGAVVIKGERIPSWAVDQGLYAESIAGRSGQSAADLLQDELALLRQDGWKVRSHAILWLPARAQGTSQSYQIFLNPYSSREAYDYSMAGAADFGVPTISANAAFDAHRPVLFIVLQWA